MAKKKAVPEVRFSGFEGEWEESKIGDIMDVSSAKRIHQSDWTTSGIRFLRARDIVSAAKNEEPAEYIYISIDKYETYSTISGKVKIGDLLVTGVGTIGVPLLVTSDAPLYFKDGNIIWFKNENTLNGNFFYYSFIGNSIQKFIGESSGLGTVGTYTIENGKKTSIMRPNEDDNAEQTRIGELFRNIDARITLEQRKYEKLQNIKKAMLEKMFPKPGATEPEVRFKGFSGEWEEKPLKDAVDVQNGRDYSHLPMGSIPVYGTGGYMLSITEALSYDDAVGIGRKGTINKPYILKAPFWTVDTLFYTVPRKNFDLQFVYCVFQRIDWKQKDESTGVPSLSKTTINCVTVLYPNKAEQTRIGEFFRNLDRLLSLQQRKCEKLQNIKKAMLGKMFV